jgi:tetratricopeptide (TPR) repeat protein
MGRLRFRPLAALVFLAFAAHPAFAQQDTDVLQGASFEITGQVRLLVGKGVVERANVRLEGFAGGLVDQTVTNSNGRFRFSGLRRGFYTVSVRAAGLKEERQQAEVSQFLRRAHIFFDLKPDGSASPGAAVPANRVLDARAPAEAQREFEKGETALGEGKAKEGISHLEKATSLFPEFLEAYHLLVNAYMETQQWAKAESALLRMLKIKPQQIEALVNLGEVKRRQKKYAEAEQTLQEAIKTDDKSWKGHFTLGRVYWEMDNIVKAGHQIGRTLELKPDLAEAHLLGGNIFMRARMPENALIEYEEYLRLAPTGEFAKQTQELVRQLKEAIAKKKK